MAVPILGVERHWRCPNCDQTAVTNEPRAHTRFHRCGGLSGFPAPMVEDGVDAKVVAVERPDYEGDDHRGVQRDGNGRPIMAVQTHRDDGMDVAVYAPTATI